MAENPPGVVASALGGKLRAAVTAKLSVARPTDLEHRLSSYEKAISGALSEVQLRPTTAADRAAELGRFLSSWSSEFVAWASRLRLDQAAQADVEAAIGEASRAAAGALGI